MSNGFDDEDGDWRSTMKVEMEASSFHDALDDLERAYRAATGTYAQSVKRIEAEFERLVDDEKRLRPQEDDSGEEDEESNEEAIQDWQNLRDYQTELGEEYSSTNGSLSLMLEAFTIALFHLWEKQIKLIGGPTVSPDGQYKHDNVIAYAKRKGWDIDPRGIKILELTCHVAKHSEGRSAQDLLQEESSLFSWIVTSANHVPGYESLILTVDRVDGFFALVRRCGPRSAKSRH